MESELVLTVLPILYITSFMWRSTTQAFIYCSAAGIFSLWTKYWYIIYWFIFYIYWYLWQLVKTFDNGFNLSSLRWFLINYFTSRTTWAKDCILFESVQSSSGWLALFINRKPTLTEREEDRLLNGKEYVNLPSPQEGKDEQWKEWSAMNHPEERFKALIERQMR